MCLRPLRPLQTVLLALVLAVTASTPATAHEPLVVEPRDGTPLTLGTVSMPRLVHATLAGPDEQLVISVTQAAGADALTVELLVPDRLPERDRDVDTQPRLRLDGPARPRIEQVAATSDDARVDEGTGLAYLPRHRARLSDGDWTITVTRGPAPVRVALLVGTADAPFATTDPRRVARTLTRVRGWYDTPAPGSEAVDEPASAGQEPVGRGAVWFAAGIAAISLLTAVWWMRTGLRRARRRGIERHRPG